MLRPQETSLILSCANISNHCGQTSPVRNNHLASLFLQSCNHGSFVRALNFMGFTLKWAG